MAFKIGALSNEERIKSGASHFVDLDYKELIAFGAVSSATIEVLKLEPRDIVDRAILDLITPFDGGATSGLTVQFGYDLTAGTDDIDAFLEAREIHLDGTEVLADGGSADTSTVDTTFGSQEVAVINSLRAKRPFAAQETGKLVLTFTATGGNLNALTTGRLRLYFNRLKLTELRPTTI